MLGRRKSPISTKKERFVFWKKCLVCVLLIVIEFLFFPFVKRYVNIQVDYRHIQADDFSFMFQVDEVRNTDKAIIIDAWAFKLNEDAIPENLELLLYETESKKIVYPKTTDYTVREDVNNYFICNNDYTQSGVVSCFASDKLDMQDKVYEILISDKMEKNIYRTGTYLDGCQVLFVNPKEYQELEVAGTDIEVIVKNGILRVYRPDVGMYVFQQGDKLYWIADTNYAFEEDGYTGVNYQIGTTQIEKLPLECQNKQWDFERREFNFEVQEVKNMNTGRFRVAVQEIPTDYAATIIQTGYYVEGWKWIQLFRPYCFVK